MELTRRKMFAMLGAVVAPLLILGGHGNGGLSADDALRGVPHDRQRLTGLGC